MTTSQAPCAPVEQNIPVSGENGAPGDDAGPFAAEIDAGVVPDAAAVFEQALEQRVDAVPE